MARQCIFSSREARETLTQARMEASGDVTVVNKQGFHARPVMRFVDTASLFRSSVRVVNSSRDGESVDGKSAMHLMLLEATQGCTLHITTCGDDALAAFDALAALVASGFDDPS